MRHGGFRWCFFLAVLGAGTSLMARGFEVPQGPEFPRSADECIVAFADAFTEHFRRSATYCTHCNDMTGFPGSRWQQLYNACYNECGDRKSSERESLVRSRHACFARAKNLQTEKDQNEVRQRGMELGDRIYHRVKNASDFLQDPAEYAAQIAKHEPDLYRGLFRDNSPESGKSLQWQLFKYATVQAEAGLDAADKLRRQSPVIGAIQKEALKRIVSVHTNVLEEFERSMKLVGEFNMETGRNFRSTGHAFNPAMLDRYSRLLAATPVSRVPLPRARVENNVAQDCSLLGDTERMNAMARENEQAVIALIERCTQ